MAKGTVFFDYDGTLHDSNRVYYPAFRAAYEQLVKDGVIEPFEFDEKWTSQWLGWTTQDMWATFLPGVPESTWRKYADIVGREMDRRTEAGLGRLFPHVPETLKALQDNGFTVAFLSNCRHRYRDAHRRTYGLDDFIDIFHCAEDFPGMAKWQIYQQVADDGKHPLPHVMVGDRFHDIEVATRNNIPAVGCLYGYAVDNELDEATRLITDIDQLPAVLEELFA